MRASLPLISDQYGRRASSQHAFTSRRFSSPAGSPDDLSVDRLVTGILFRFASPDYAADLVASSLSYSLTESSFIIFLQNAAQPVVPLSSLIAGHSSSSVGEWTGQNTSDGMVSVGKIQVQHRLQE